MNHRVAVVGASGYAGGELLRLIDGHPDLSLTVATAYSNAGSLIRDVHPNLISLGDAAFVATDPELLADADLLFVALPTGRSPVLAAALPASTKIVDLGGDHRLRDKQAYQRYYGGEHPGAWTYGMAELPGQRAAIAATNRVAATGCYVMATSLALAPLIAAGVASPEDVVVVAASGTSGAGRTAKIDLLGAQVMGNLSAYKLGVHQHCPEMKQATGATSLSFTPVLAPMPRGILATVTARPTGKVTTATVREILAEAYADEPFVHLLGEGVLPNTSSTLGSNACQLQAAVDVDSGRIIVISAIDNLGKGSAGNMVQCANLMLGLPETAGLTTNGVAP